VNDGRHIIAAMGIAPHDVNLAYIPMSHSYGIGNLVMPLLWQGTPLALRPSFNAARFMQDARTTGATVFPGVPFMFAHLRASQRPMPESLRLLISAGARIDPRTVAWFHRQHGCKVHAFYGSSETGGISYDDSDALTDSATVGRPLPETEVEAP